MVQTTIEATVEAFGYVIIVKLQAQKNIFWRFCNGGHDKIRCIFEETEICKNHQVSLDKFINKLISRRSRLLFKVSSEAAVQSCS